MKAEETIVKQMVNIQSGYPAFFKFGDSDKAIVIQSPCDGLAKAIQHYRRNFSKGAEIVSSGYGVNATIEISAGNSAAEEAPLSTASGAQSPIASQRTLPFCGKCGSESWIKIDGCLVCQGCGFSKCG